MLAKRLILCLARHLHRLALLERLARRAELDAAALLARDRVAVAVDLRLLRLHVLLRAVALAEQLHLLLGDGVVGPPLRELLVAALHLPVGAAARAVRGCASNCAAGWARAARVRGRAGGPAARVLRAPGMS